MGCTSSRPVVAEPNTASSNPGGDANSSAAAAAVSPHMPANVVHQTSKASKGGRKKTKSKDSSSNSNNNNNSSTTRPRMDSWATTPAIHPSGSSGTAGTGISGVVPTGSGVAHTAAATAGAASSSAAGASTTSQQAPQQQQQQQHHSHHYRSTVESQWNYLWNTYQAHLVDPVDVPAVIDLLLQRTVNRLSASQMTFLQRKVRAELESLTDLSQFPEYYYNAADHGKGGSNEVVLPQQQQQSSSNPADSSNNKWGTKKGGLWAAASPNNNNGNLTQLTAEARAAAEKSHVLLPAVWQRVLPTASWPRCSQQDNNNNAVVPDLYALLLQNVQHLLLHLSVQDNWGRVAVASQKAAQAARLELDVNKRDNNNNNKDNNSSSAKNNNVPPPPPKPSTVPEWTQAVTLPVGVSLQALATLLALAVTGSRRERLHLLFYLLMKDLPAFLDWHPAGGVPVWLLEVNDTHAATTTKNNNNATTTTTTAAAASSSDDGEKVAKRNDSTDDDDNNNTSAAAADPVVCSLASLTHYHYYGTAFLPPSGSSSKDDTKGGDDDNKNKSAGPPPFCPSRSRQPVTVSGETVIHLVQALLRPTTPSSVAAAAAATSTTTEPAAAPPSPSPPNSRRNLFHKGSSNVNNNSNNNNEPVTGSSAEHLLPNGSHHKSDYNNNHLSSNGGGSNHSGGSNNNNDTLLARGTFGDPNQLVTERIFGQPWAVATGSANGSNSSGGYYAVMSEHILDASLVKLATAPFPKTSSAGNIKEDWTLQDYATWADAAIDDAALEMIMHRLLGAGVMPYYGLEKDLVTAQWVAWQQESEQGGVDNWPYAAAEAAAAAQISGAATTTTGKSLMQSVQQALGSSSTDRQQHANGYKNSNNNANSASSTMSRNSSRGGPVWGGLGGMDGGGGIGYGFMYCVDKKWWNSWVAYVGWSWLGERPNKRRTFTRPGALSNERLLDREAFINGSMGSYEVMKHGLLKNKDYILVPPGVWNVLYELYGGGPPLPRMVKPGERKFSDMNRLNSEPSDSAWDDGIAGGADGVDDLDAVMEELGLDTAGRVSRLPDSLQVATHPWILHCQLCDPTQPYRRGDLGTMSIRVMVAPDQPLWRLLAEIVARFPLNAFKAYDSKRQEGRGRLWKRVDPSGAGGKPGASPTSRYGPWNLLCKSRHAKLPLLNEEKADDVNLEELTKDWKAYSDNATVEGALLADQDHLMFEFAVQNKQGELIWPREAAAKAGRVRRLVEEENEFRRILQGFDEDGNMMLQPPNLVGMDIDAMDGNGRWYPVKIQAVEIVDDDTTDEDESDGRSDEKGTTSKRVRVDFSEHGGHVDWIDVESDRLGPAGRFTNEAEQQQNGPSSPKANGSNATAGNAKAKGPVVMKKSSSADNTTELAKICLYPGYGACGLTNLGNTCYMNSALQCISYLPLLRSYLLSGQFKATGDLNKDNPLGTGGKLLEESAELLRVMWSARLGEKSPTRFKALLGRINSQFAGADQQDAQEFLNYILDVLHEDSNRVQNKPYVEALEDDWVKKTSLPRVGEEAWRRFLRRNRSIMADVAMGQVLNTVTCPVCSYSSRNFDPFNLLSIPIPTVADVVFQVTVVRRATASNCPWVLNRAPRGSKRSTRFSRKTLGPTGEPPCEANVAEQYVITMSRLADSKDLRVQIEKCCGIPAANLRICRAEEVNADKSADERLLGQTKLFLLNDKEGPCSQLAKKRHPNDDSPAGPTLIYAFENTLNVRQEIVKEDRSEDETVADDETTSTDEQAGLQNELERYGNPEECRLLDSDPLAISKAISRSIWPRTAQELKVGLRVDAKDHRGNWFAGSVIDMFDEIVDAGDADTGEEVRIETKKVCVHFDNFSSKWDETYTIDHFTEGTVRPVYMHAAPKGKPTEFVIFNRRTDPSTGQAVYFGQPSYVQCQNEWSNARAGAHIVAQTARFMQYRPEKAPASDDSSIGDRESRSQRIYDKACSVMSDLIDLLVESDRHYVRSALGVAGKAPGDESSGPYRNPSFDGTALSVAMAKKVSELMPRLPFEVRLCSSDPSGSDKTRVEEEIFPFSLTRTIGNHLNARNAIVLHWRAPPKDRKTSSSIRAPVMYVEPHIDIHKDSAELLKKNSMVKMKEKGKKARPGSAGMDLGVCLTEFCKMQKLSLDDNWRCPRCKDFREGKQDMNLWRLPDLLTFHIKRFNMSARWREKITTKVNFPLTGLDMSEWCHEESPVIREDPADSYVYDLIGVMNHYGSMTGGHYVATAKATSCGRDGKEEAGFGFNGIGIGTVESEESDAPSGWRLGRAKQEVNQGKAAAALSSRAVSTSAEPMWLQFDDELVEPIPPDHVVSEMAYVLFYRRRRISPSNIARYSTLE